MVKWAEHLVGGGGGGGGRGGLPIMGPLTGGGVPMSPVNFKE